MKVKQIYVPKPCTENWAEMSEQERGRFCNSCQKTVYDFTTASDRFIVEKMKSEKNLCGRFLASQLDRDLIAPQQKSSVWMALASGILTFSSFGSITWAQSKPQTLTMFQPNLDAGKVEDASLQTQTKAKLVKVTVTGFLIEDGLPMPMVDIKIKGKRAKTSTDFDGKFTIDAKIGDIITASYVGYETYEHIITLDDNNLIINMRPDVTELSGVVVTGGSRKRTFFGRIVRDVRNWFR